MQKNQLCRFQEENSFHCNQLSLVLQNITAVLGQVNFPFCRRSVIAELQTDKWIKKLGLSLWGGSASVSGV